MFGGLFKKDFKLMLKSSSTIVMVVVIPLLIILIFGFTMKNYMNCNFGTFDDSKVLYFTDNASVEMMDKFADISAKIGEKTGAEFEEVTDYDKPKKSVNKSDAVGLVKISGDSFDYYRSPYNETYGGKIIRSLFTEIADGSLTSSEGNGIAVVQTVLDVKSPSSYVYYTLIGMVLSILFIGTLMASSYGKDYESGTLKRFYISKTNTVNMWLSKTVCVIIFGIVQIAFGMAISTIIFKIKWPDETGRILLVFLSVLVFAISFGSVIGIFIKNVTMSYTSYCVIVMIFSYLGGAITPVYMLERIPVLKWIIRISPVYWTNQSITKLYNGIVDSTTTKCIAMLLILSVVCLAVHFICSRKMLFGIDAKEADDKKTKKEKVAA